MARKATVSRMVEVAKMLGVEYNKAFKIKEAPLSIYKIVEDGLIQYDRERDCWDLVPRTLTEILAGYIEIVEPVWEPKQGELYYTPVIPCSRPVCKECCWTNGIVERDYYDMGLVCKTREEAVELARRMLDVAKENKDEQKRIFTCTSRKSSG